MHTVNNAAILNIYPDSIGQELGSTVKLLQRPDMANTFESTYVLPSIFNSDLDRGFSIIDYSLNKLYASEEDLNALKKLGLRLKLDFVLNHISVLSPQFQDILKHGDSSKYIDFFIQWNKFWQGCGEMTEQGYIQPKSEYLDKMFFRKPGLPILMVRLPNGSSQPYWNTFYQQINYEPLSAQTLFASLGIQYSTAERIAAFVNIALANNTALSDIDFGEFAEYKAIVTQQLDAKRQYLGQMDLNIASPLVWEYYEETLQSLSKYGAKIVRLDAFAYAPKKAGERNFLNDPDTWELLSKVRTIADKYSLELLPEIHASYEEKIYAKISDEGYIGYDFFLPGLLLDALENKRVDYLEQWANELQSKKIQVVNMLGCHDGIPLLDLKGLLPEEDINNLIATIVSRGGLVKNLHGQKNMYYQVNATYYSALCESDKKMLLARALQLFMPGKPQIWYLDLFAGKNNYDAVKNAGAARHKEINRTNLSSKDIENAFKQDIVKDQIKLLQMRNTFPAFGFDATMSFTKSATDSLIIQWQKAEHIASLTANLSTNQFSITLQNGDKQPITFHNAI